MSKSKSVVIASPHRSISKNCPYCRTLGVASSMHNKTDLTMICPSCKQKWYSRSGTCPDCGQANGYISHGPCVACYEVRKKGIRRVG